MRMLWLTIALSGFAGGEGMWLTTDSIRNLQAAQEAQASFERVRSRQAPWGRWAGSGPCDERVGRFCLTHSGARDDDERPPYRPPVEPESIVAARQRLDSILSEIARAQPGDAWVAGQRVAYRGERQDWTGALAAAEECQSPEPGWCGLLLGFALHGMKRVDEAERAYRTALSQISDAERRVWWDPEVLVENDVYQYLRRMPADQQQSAVESLWARADPFYLEGGNALLTEHFSRHTLAKIRSNARNPHAMRWGDDLTEILLRLGPEVGWERLRDPGIQPGFPGVSARFSWDSRGVFPQIEAFTHPVEAGMEVFSVANTGTRSRHAPPRALRLRDLPARFTRFQRGDTLVVVASWEVPSLPAWDSVPALALSEGALFFQPVEAGSSVTPAPPQDRLRVDLSPRASGVAEIRVPSRGGILSLELLDEEGGRGWRARQGSGTPLQGMSDLFLLRPEPRPDLSDELRLEDVLDRALHSNSFDGGTVAVAWEVYQLPALAAPLAFRVFLERSEGSWLRRAGEALRLLSPRPDLRLGWNEVPDAGERDGQGVLFRTIDLDLSGLASGLWVLRIEVESPDAELRSSSTLLRIR